MKIIMPIDEDRKNICVSFGRTPLFLLHDTENGQNEYIENPAAVAAVGAGIKAAQTVINAKADALISFRCGENAAQVLRAAEIKIYKAENPDVGESIKNFEAGALKELENFHAGFHGEK